ncbi:metallophosphoesterase [Methylovirgula sp. 4M-Z18]|uniref:metallophosphoesterase n=1 Tax=Methylovirgula sp. 4M-Z18 TaxID=2293567 RepID=UPI000E2EA1A6|nr:metallophosphoesterase [Methylovirgula sp. 4M-Z18]RFB80142.1 metallophosphoesterase [Methylovirgula sp. 4M-Z18]
MALVTRRAFLTGASGVALGTLGLGSYAFAVEPGFLLTLTRYAPALPRWPVGQRLKIAVIADIHACEPWMPAARIRHIADFTNTLQPDLIVILGDYVAGHNVVTGPVLPEAWGEALSVLQAPLGVYAILGNHDWWHGPLMTLPGDGGKSVRLGLKRANIQVLENDAIRLANAQGRAFWLLGLSDQLAFVHHHAKGGRIGADDLPGTLAKVKDEAPIILLAHEPRIFPHVPEQVALTLCGHTHGGQVNVPGLTQSFVATAGADSRYIYGHIVEGNKHLIISAGLGTSIMPVRFMRPPEVVEINLGETDAA